MLLLLQYSSWGGAVKINIQYVSVNVWHHVHTNNSGKMHSECLTSLQLSVVKSESKIEKDIHAQWELLLFESARESAKFLALTFLATWFRARYRQSGLPVLVVNDLFSRNYSMMSVFTLMNPKTHTSCLYFECHHLVKSLDTEHYAETIFCKFTTFCSWLE